MNAFGEFLYQLRKEHGMTQAALAEKLGVTNKAVSKWETGEAMPETDLLVPLAEIFGVTVDELLRGGRSGESDAKTAPRQEDIPVSDGADVIKNNPFTRGKDDGTDSLPEKICGVVCAALVFGGIAVYLFFGALANLWHPYWVVIPSCALGSGIIGIVSEWFDKEKCKKKWAKGENPYTGGICGIVVLACIIAYLLLGALANLWHPYWIVVIVGVAVGSLIAAIGNCFGLKKK